MIEGLSQSFLDIWNLRTANDTPAIATNGRIQSGLEDMPASTSDVALTGIIVPPTGSIMVNVPYPSNGEPKFASSSPQTPTL